MDDPPGRRQFDTTQWSLVAAAGADDASRTRAREALEQLCRDYWFPLYAFVRSRGHSVADAQDLTQAFFANLLESGGFASADRDRGRFRSYLLGAMKHFLANEWHRARTKKRGGEIRFLEWDAEQSPEDRFAAAAATGNPEQRFDREWALETVASALDALRREMEAAGKRAQFDALRGSLTGAEETSRKEIAGRLGMSEGAVKVAVHRLRRRYRHLLRAVVAETVGTEAGLDDEMRYLLEVLRRQ